MRFPSILLLTLGAGASSSSTTPTVVTTTPPYFDEWCEQHCSSLETCNDLFNDNFVDLRLRVRSPINEGTGRHLIPGKYFGSTISRQSFETQFVLDVASALEISPCRLYVTSVFPEGNENYWDTESVFITFRLFPADPEFVATLTKLIQEPQSTLYDGHVTNTTDALYGLVALQWDYSFKLMYSISIIGGDDVINSTHGRYLNQGSSQACPDHSNSIYCVFEEYLTNDMEVALDLQAGLFVVLFVKEADRHSVIVSFRLVPEGGQDIAWVQTKVTELLRQLSDSRSLLHTAGNVTYKIDPTWGVSGMSKQQRHQTKYLSRPAPPSPSDAYERCKATHRCSRAWSRYNQTSAHSSHTYQEYLDGNHIEVPLFLDFEDWRRGIRGWEQSCRSSDDNEPCLPASVSDVEYYDKPAGAHWSPFEFAALGPSVPTFSGKWNNGLVLNKKSKDLDVSDQMDLIDKYESLVTWMEQEFQHGVTGDPMLRSREQIIKNITNYTDTIVAERKVLSDLSQSQCSNAECNLIFNTSDATLTGAVNATGVIVTTSDGTEVALWAFDSIDIDDNVNVTLTGQRAMAIISRSSVRINTTLNVIPGTLGGFPGGFSVARRSNERLTSVCNELDSREFLHTCPGDQPISELAKGIKSNNVNGPGSPSTRVYLMTIQTTAPIVNEIQSLTTNADQGQTLSGKFRLHFNNYSTPLLSHDITASDLKRKVEDSLNPAKRNRLSSFDRTDSAAGIGVVDITRETFGSSGGYRWDITFASAVGNIGKDSSQLTAANHLVSKGARVEIKTLRHGNSIGGKFALQFLGNETRLISHDVSAPELEDILKQDITPLSTVHVLRNDPIENCNDGYCDNGSDRSGGYIWTLTLTTQVGNNSPSSPTSMEFDNEGEIANMTAMNQLTGCVDAQCPTIQIEMGHSQSHNKEMRSIFGKKPFSLAYGGAGAGYGGKGGDGFGTLPPGKPYGDERVSALVGGSGGAVGVEQPFQLGVFKKPRGRGGSGGGAIEIVAANDVILGSNAVISCNGDDGASSYMSGGGGGSGGSILIAAGGVVHIDGKLSVKGGQGGRMKATFPKNAQTFGGHGGGGGGGRMALYGQSVMIGGETSTISLDSGNCSATYENCSGWDGTLSVESALDTEVTVDHTIGAEGTRSSLYLKPRTKRPPFNPRKLLTTTKSGPEFDLGSSVRPSKVSFYFRVENTSKSGWDATFELRESRWSYLTSKAHLNYTSVVGIVIGREIRHGVNYVGMPFDDDHIKQLEIIKPSSESNMSAWTKVDIRFNWEDHTHDVYIDDVRLVQRSPFRGGGIRAISLSIYFEGGRVWFDEIYVGEDTTIWFHCPVVLPDGTLQMDRPLQKGWKPEDLGAESSLRPMQRHESHVSLRAMYQRENNKFVVPFDGQGENDFTSDVKHRAAEGDRAHEKGKVLAGSLLRLPSSRPSDNNHSESYRPSAETTSSGDFGMHPDTFIWYGEHDHYSDPRELSGAVMACSTQDFVTWRNEGAMLHYSNITDMVDGSSGPLRVEKPKVLYNNSTLKYVMWMIVDNGVRELGMAGVAVSDYPNGPFEFVRSFYPDGNQTRDQTLFQDNDSGAAYLFRTYYDTVEYVLPAAVMQPTWESVKNADGNTNHALSYHRAEYHPGYDDYHDIYVQRWRTEDKPWKIICINRLTHQEREVPYGKENLNFDGEVCQDPFEYKRVLGQGNPTYEASKNGIQSRFLDPNDPTNNVWVPNSVPGVKGQPWMANYEDGVCGKRKINDDMQPYDPNLPFREQPDRGDCSNIVDNPIHPTLPDKRIGPETVVERRRAKFVAVSRLTDDYLDTSGIIKTFEGELGEGADLLSLVRQYNEDSDSFGWSDASKDVIGSTLQPQIHDNQFAQVSEWDLEHHQYEKGFNDRSFYSPACVYDGQCPVNFSVNK